MSCYYALVKYTKSYSESMDCHSGHPRNMMSHGEFCGRFRIAAALKTFGVRKLVISTPCSDSVNQAEKAFLEAGSFEVLDIRGLGYTDPNCMPHATVADMYRLTKELLRPEADTVFVSCTGIQVMDGIQTPAALRFSQCPHCRPPPTAEPPF
ncbi:hypothetical protein [Oscillibacter sp.]|uniref:aspartate racemase/maleate isomerase family protein n=1 Tax=Oscillibacter sp. TaxID=1945593 RepID=UPI0025E10501|nr:hypothetical protein [Oscillibacter sp.]